MAKTKLLENSFACVSQAERYDERKTYKGNAKMRDAVRYAKGTDASRSARYNSCPIEMPHCLYSYPGQGYLVVGLDSLQL